MTTPRPDIDPAGINRIYSDLSSVVMTQWGTGTPVVKKSSETNLLQRRDLNSSYTLGSSGKTGSNPNPSGHDGEGDSKAGQTRKKPRDLSPYDREECGRGEGGGVYDVCIRYRGS